MEQDFGCVLQFCNDVRHKLGRQPVTKLRKGTRTDGEYCPVARTINHASRKHVIVDTTTVAVLRIETQLPVGGTTPCLVYHEDPVAVPPQCVVNFIRAFDHNELPQFEGKGWTE